MPTITADGRSIEVDAGTRLVLAIEALGIDIGHRCGGKARCTTCRVAVEAGAPATYTRAEFLKLQGAGLLAPEGAAEPVRLSCQVLVEGDMTMRVLKTKQTEGWPDTGPEVGADLVPEVERFDRATLEAEVAAG
ncbi:MAG: 2Fe-2S iron-sulfur cluster-binding protein [Trueperaceae bacterium]|nr:2Fe-2S iron-sulfur cluster-binding protein [Trueperaceae bacterium]